MSAKEYESEGIKKPLHARRMARLRHLMKVAAIPFLLLLVRAQVQAQAALDGFDPNANGTVRVVVVQPDGKILLGGEFTTLSPNGGAPVTRNHIARLNPDGTLDTAFDPNANGMVRLVVVQLDGKILLGGDFTMLSPNGGGAVTRRHIARLNPDGTLDTTFDPNPNTNSEVRSIAVQTDAKILVGGQFTSIGGQTRNNIARLDPTTGLADSWNPNANAAVYAITMQADGRVLAGGGFQSIGGQTRNNIARLDPTSGLADSFDPNADGEVDVITVQTDGKILVGGQFTTIGGLTRNYIARLDATTGSADSFNPSAISGVLSIAVQADGKILAGGFFSVIGGQLRSGVARLDATTGLADSFNPNPNNWVFSIAVQADGKILAGGAFNTVAPIGAAVTRNHIARLETDGRLDQTLNLSAVGNLVYATAIQPDGKILIGGGFTSVLGVTRNNIARLNTDGTLDVAFNPNADSGIDSIAVQADGKILVGGGFSNIGGQPRNRIARLDATTGLADLFNPNVSSGQFHSVVSIAVQADGKILAGGEFTTIGGQMRSYIARLDTTTGLADSFNPSASSIVYSIVVQADGKILAGGNFTAIGGQTRKYIARLDATTGLADSFDPNANNQVHSIAVHGDGKILAGGQFTTIGGQPRNRIGRLDGTTGLADSFNPNANGFVYSIAVQTDGKILAGGRFTSIGGQTRNRIARLDSTAGAADLFDPNASDWVHSIAVQADGKILVGGEFTTISGQPRSIFARLNNDTAALQNLAVTQTTLTWTRDGSSPQLTRATFEYSNDNVNYTSLGNGIPQSGSSNWTLTGLNLPTGQNIYIRARGYYRSGYLNGSENITESVRYGPAGPPAPTPTPTATPSPTATPTPSATPRATPTPTPTPTITPAVTPTPTATSTPSSTPVSTPSTLGNISTRLRVLSGDNALIGGLIATGTEGKKVIIRAIGPTLSDFGVPGALMDPTLDLYQGSTLLFSNDNWRDSSQQAEIKASGFAPNYDAEAAIIWTLTPGLNYTAIVRGKNDATGIGLVEAFDLDRAVSSKLGNISTRGFVDVDDNVMIAGLIVGPSNGPSTKILARALGPTLTDFGVPNALTDPTLDLVNSSGTVVRSNNNWKDDDQQRAEIEAAGLAPSHDQEAALVETVAPGAYTVVVRGSNRATGVGLVEAYNIP